MQAKAEIHANMNAQAENPGSCPLHGGTSCPLLQLIMGSTQILMLQFR
jgi:hypothetical protein